MNFTPEQKAAAKPMPMFLRSLRDVRGTDGAILTDHLWFTLTKGFAALDLKPGDTIQFDARSRSYKKGYRGRRDDEDLPAPSTDYRLSHPTKIRKLGFIENEAGKTIEELNLKYDSGA